MERYLKNNLANIKSRLQQGVFEISSCAKSLTKIITVENDSTGPSKALHLLSIMLLISLIFLSPDKIPLIYAPFQADKGISEKMQEIAKIVKRLVPNIG